MSKQVDSWSLKDARKQHQEQGVFHTPTALALKIKKLLNLDNVTEVYDPTVGSGSLLAVFDDSVKKYGQELDEQMCEYCREHLVNCEIVHGDTLKDPAFKDHKFMAIVANPPYSVKWEPSDSDERFSVAPAIPPKATADYAFILHCLHYLADTGRAVILLPPGILFRGNAEGKIRKWLLQKNWVEKIVAFAPKAFDDTAIATVAVVFAKNKATTDVVFEDTTIGKGRVVPLSEIEKNDFNLSIHRYVFNEIKEEAPDVLKNFIAFRETAIESLKNILDIEWMLHTKVAPTVSKYDEFIAKLEEVINAAKSKRNGRDGVSQG